jgi:hypothetical protein
MRRALPYLFILLAAPLLAADGDQSYISYNDGDNVVRQAYDGRDIEARVNLPVFAGDQLVTGRRGRSEIRLADGSIIAVDRESAVEITSIANTFESEDTQSVVSLRRGAAIVHLQRDEDVPIRLDTPVATYVALAAGIYSVELDARGRDEITVLSGATEVRTRERSYRLRAGEAAQVDESGIYDIRSARGDESSFERWYLQRVDRYEGRRSRYLDSRYAWVEADLDDHGDWVYVGEFGWVWRPYVVAGWRPYYHGSWVYGPRGHLIWSSYEPWGWYPYHYGRWTHSRLYGWVWLPGYRYSPAWVYWAYGPSWVGWVPSGWYDCYRPYNWIWNGYHVGRTTVGVGFFGRINLVGSDLSGWTILESGTIVSTRVDRAAMTLDQARSRMARDGGHGVFSSSPVRFTRDDIKDPAAAVGRVSRLGLGGGTGKEGSGSLADLTPFFRRDPELSPAVRAGLDRSNLSEAARRITVPTPSPDRATSQTPSSRTLRGAVNRTGGAGGSSSAAGGRTIGTSPSSQPRQGTIQRTVPSAQAPSDAGGRIERSAPTTESPRATPSTGGRIERSAPSETPRAAPAPSTGGRIERSEPSSDRSRSVTREPGGGSVQRLAPVETTRPEAAPRSESGSDDSWRGRIVRSEASPAPRAESPEPQPERVQRDWRSTPTYDRDRAGSPDRGGSSARDATPIPRQVIDRIGGARIVPNRDSGETRSSGDRGRISAPRGSSSREPSVSREPSSSRSSASPRSSSGSSGGSVSRPSSSSSSPRSSTSSSRSAPAPSRSEGGSRSNMRKQ